MILRKAPCALAIAAMLALPTAALAAEKTAPAPAAEQTAPAPAPAPAAVAAPSGDASFITKADPGQYRASKLVGVKIHNDKNETIGSVNEVMIDKKGSIVAVVIGVGGFLGIGEKNVALPYTAVTWSDTPPVQAPTPGASPSTAPGTAPAAPAPEAQPAKRVLDYPVDGKLAMTKEQLEAAPDFKFASETVTQ